MLKFAFGIAVIVAILGISGIVVAYAAKKLLPNQDEKTKTKQKSK